ncbi:hypothetical protein K525DRAFT_257220 [Schizophyllum commune Loenen D]|nr:hypothetical protein K525DRAFT_257220 [Schizophyllum commune Loenen D]
MVQTAPFRTRLNFANDKTAPGAFEFPFVKLVANGESLYLSPNEVPMHDLRKEAKKPTLEDNGFTWVNLPFAELDGPEGWQDRYAKFTCDYIKSITGAKEVRCINYQIRRRTPGDEDNVDANYDQAQEKALGMQPVPAVHVDINKERARTRLLAAFDGEHQDAERVAIINVWRPLNGPVMDAPLALCDASTLDPSDMMWTTDKYGGGYFIRHNENMRWMYVHDQLPDEALIFRQFDNTIPYGKAGCVPHTAFFDEERKNMGKPRSSIELRLALVY